MLSAGTFGLNDLEFPGVPPGVAGAAAVAEAGSGHVSPSTSREATARSTV